MTRRSVALAVAFVACFVSHVRSQGTGTTQTVYGPGQGVANPAVLYEEKPQYTEAAMRAKIQGVVEVEAVVLANGIVGEVRIHKSLDQVFGLDEVALATAKKWRFRPAHVNGKDVPFKVIIQLEFRTSPPGQSEEEALRFALREGTPGLVMPKAKSVPAPKYTADAMRAKLQGSVEVEVVVGPTGNVDWARVRRSLDKQYGLDEQAMFAVSRATFEPGTLDGKPVPVWTTLTLEFRIR